MTLRLHNAFNAFTLALCSTTALAVGVTGQGTWATTLQGLDLDGNASTFEAYYDTTLDITWLANANLAATNQFGLTLSGTYFDSMANTVGITGLMTWSNAKAWITGMNAVNYLGYNDWRLPTMMDTGAPGCDNAFSGTDCGSNVQTGDAATTVYSEMASLWYDTLGNTAYYDTSGNPAQPGWGLTNTGPFSNFQAQKYWSGLRSSTASGAWVFGADKGLQSPYYFNNSYFYAMAVRSDNDVALPLPAAAGLFASGLFGLLGTLIGKRRSRKGF